MNKTITISTIALLAVVMGMSSIAPAMAESPLRIGDTCDGLQAVGTVCLALDLDGDGECDRAIGFVKASVGNRVANGACSGEELDPIP